MLLQPETRRHKRMCSQGTLHLVLSKYSTMEQWLWLADILLKRKLKSSMSVLLETDVKASGSCRNEKKFYMRKRCKTKPQCDLGVFRSDTLKMILCIPKNVSSIWDSDGEQSFVPVTGTFHPKQVDTIVQHVFQIPVEETGGSVPCNLRQQLWLIKKIQPWDAVE